jgi:hypothetical protein
MKLAAAQIRRGLETTLPTGKKLDPEPTTMQVSARHLGPTSPEPPRTTRIGVVDPVLVFKAPADDREPPNVFRDSPKWLLEDGLFGRGPRPKDAE